MPQMIWLQKCFMFKIFMPKHHTFLHWRNFHTFWLVSGLLGLASPVFESLPYPGEWWNAFKWKHIVQVYLSCLLLICWASFEIEGLCPVSNKNWFCHMFTNTCDAECAWNGGCICHGGILFWGYTLAGVYVSCTYSHAMWSYLRRFGSCCCVLCQVLLFPFVRWYFWLLLWEHTYTPSWDLITTMKSIHFFLHCFHVK